MATTMLSATTSSQAPTDSAGNRSSSLSSRPTEYGSLPLSRSCTNGFARRSMKYMDGLLGAEVGDSMVVFDPTNSDSRYRDGQRIALPVDIRCESGEQRPPSPSVSLFERPTFMRNDTLLTSSDTQNSLLLKKLLGNSSARVKPGASVVTRTLPIHVFELEQAKRNARVSIDLSLESSVCVQGGVIRGTIAVTIQNLSKYDNPILICSGRSSSPFQMITDIWQSMFASDTLDPDSFSPAREGTHFLPFAISLPVSDEFGKAKGAATVHLDIGVRYIVMASLKTMDPVTGKKSIAHFYRNCEIWPRVNPSEILSPAPRPLRSTISKSIGNDESEKVVLTAALHRLYWVAGQQCSVKITIENQSSRAIKTLSATLIQSLVIFKPKPDLAAESIGSGADPDACKTTSSHSAVSESVLRVEQSGMKGLVISKDWSGVPSGEKTTFYHFVPIPSDALTIVRGRLLEIEYRLRVSLRPSGSKGDIFVSLPIRIFNMLSIDPPPSVITDADYARIVAEGDVLASYRMRFAPPNIARMPMTNPRETREMRANNPSAFSNLSATTLSSSHVENGSRIQSEPFSRVFTAPPTERNSSAGSGYESSVDEPLPRSSLRAQSMTSMMNDNAGTEVAIRQAIASSELGTGYTIRSARPPSQSGLTKGRGSSFFNSIRGSYITKGKRPERPTSLEVLGPNNPVHVDFTVTGSEPIYTRSLSTFAARVQEKLSSLKESLATPANTGNGDDPVNEKLDRPIQSRSSPTRSLPTRASSSTNSSPFSLRSSGMDQTALRKAVQQSRRPGPSPSNSGNSSANSVKDKVMRLEARVREFSAGSP